MMKKSVFLRIMVLDLAGVIVVTVLVTVFMIRNKKNKG